MDEGYSKAHPAPFDDELSMPAAEQKIELNLLNKLTEAEMLLYSLWKLPEIPEHAKGWIISTGDAVRSLRTSMKPPAANAERDARCESCDGSGDVHRADGEWIGYCHCAAGTAMKTAAPRDGDNNANRN